MLQVIPDEILVSVQSAPYPRIAVCHMCRWVSIIPGITIPPAASTSTAPAGAASPGPTAAIRSPSTSTSASASTVCASSMVSTIPPRKTTESYLDGICSGSGIATACSDCLRTNVRYTARWPNIATL